jgi:predicted nucleic acid-binding protein
MRRLKIYLETTMFNHYFDTDRETHADTVKLFREVQAGKYEAFTSSYVVGELEETGNAEKRAGMLALISECNITVIPADNEADRLADIYVNEGVIPAAKRYDGLHIAIATVSDLDCIFSLNFRHINRLKTKTLTGLINAKEGYRPIAIASPSEVV